MDLHDLLFLKGITGSGSGLTANIKQALIDCFEHVAWIDDDGQDYVNALESALYPATLTSISAVYTQPGTIYDSTALNSLKTNLVVTAHYSDSTTRTIASSNYTLSGTLTAGTSTVTVTYRQQTTTFTVTVTESVAGTYSVSNSLTGATSSNAATTVTENTSYSATITASSGYTLAGATVSVMMGEDDITSTAYNNGTISIASVTGNIVITVTAVAVTLSSISAVYTQSGTVYNTDSLDSLKSDLVVTATWSDSTTTTLEDYEYTLSGTLTVGTSIVTVSYGGKTTTFNVTVTKTTDYSEDALENVTWTDGYTYSTATGELTANANSHCTSKFSLQDCIYNPNSTNSGDSSLSLFFWDENDNYLGFYSCLAGGKGATGQFNSAYKCAIKIDNTSGTFDSSLLTMMPVDHRSVAVPKFSIALADYINDFEVYQTWSNKNYEFRIPISVLNLTTYGLTQGSPASKINHVNQNWLDFNTYSETGLSNILVVRTNAVWNPNGAQLSWIVKGINTVEDMKQWITTNNPVITFN